MENYNSNSTSTIMFTTTEQQLNNILTPANNATKSTGTTKQTDFKNDFKLKTLQDFLNESTDDEICAILKNAESKKKRLTKSVPLKNKKSIQKIIL